MRRTSTDCDMCDSKDIDAIEVSLTTGRSSDPAGGLSTDDVESLDICKKCAARFIGIMKTEIGITHEESSRIIERVKRSRKEYKKSRENKERLNDP